MLASVQRGAGLDGSSLASWAGSSLFLAEPLCPSFLVYIGSPAQFSVFPELILGPGRNGCDVAGHVFSASQNHRQPEGDVLKVLMGGKFGAQRQVGEAPLESLHGLERKEGYSPPTDKEMQTQS